MSGMTSQYFQSPQAYAEGISIEQKAGQRRGHISAAQEFSDELFMGTKLAMIFCVSFE